MGLGARQAPAQARRLHPDAIRRASSAPPSCAPQRPCAVPTPRELCPDASARAPPAPAQARRLRLDAGQESQIDGHTNSPSLVYRVSACRRSSFLQHGRSGTTNNTLHPFPVQETRHGGETAGARLVCIVAALAGKNIG